ncbi:MAG: cytochrome b5-like heme/steroid binding domain-containing protein, partial [Candidatus Vogelbacteria bacterium]|nr:cytochrome b5-like heme/steroid binding domain-containing protein [Candidatus Vogelbacteria bacterium]
AKHNNACDCWTIIYCQVYNLTSFADLHSGGPQAILGTCGVDSTTAFFNRHSTRELNILAQYLIGSVGQTISAAPAGQATKTTSPAPAPGRFNRENDD